MTTTTPAPAAPSQRDRVAAQLRQWGGIDADASRRLGIGQTRTRILELRRLGWHVETCHDFWCPGGHYILLSAPDEADRRPGLGL